MAKSSKNLQGRRFLFFFSKRSSASEQTPPTVSFFFHYTLGLVGPAATHVLPLLPDERPIPQEVFEGEVVDVGPGGGAVPRHLQPAGVQTDRGGGHTLRRVWFNCRVGKKKHEDVLINR